MFAAVMDIPSILRKHGTDSLRLVAEPSTEECLGDGWQPMGRHSMTLSDNEADNLPR